MPGDSGQDSSHLRAAFAEEIAVLAGCPAYSPVSRAFASVAREDFLGEPPWRIKGRFGPETVGGHQLHKIYQDVLVELDRSKRINNGQPSLWARVFSDAELKDGQRILQIGAGTGYYTAILAEIVGSSGKIIALELEDDLAQKARENLADWPQARVVCEDGTHYDAGKIDRIVVCAGVVRPPDLWLDSLVDGGILLMPLTANSGHGLFVRIEKLSATCWSLQALMSVSFYPCFGTRQPEIEAGLSDLLDAGRLMSRGGCYLWRADIPPAGLLLDMGHGLWLTDFAGGPSEGSRH